MGPVFHPSIPRFLLVPLLVSNSEEKRNQKDRQMMTFNTNKKHFQCFPDLLELNGKSFVNTFFIPP